MTENSKLQLRQIRKGKQFGDKSEILAGLDEGEVVATDPVRAGVFLKQELKQAQKSKNKGAK